MRAIIMAIIGMLLIAVLYFVPDVIGTYDEEGNDIGGME